MKATYTEITGLPYDVYKDPKTSDGTKKSAKGLLHVTPSLELVDQATKQLEAEGALQTVFTDGKLLTPTTLSEIRNRLH